MNTKDFSYRQLGVHPDNAAEVLEQAGFTSWEDIPAKVIPESILDHTELDLPRRISESQSLAHLKELANKNQQLKNYIGYGYHDTTLPPVIQRNILENPGWYTAYTPYQAEIAQGRLEALINFQTMVSDLAGLPLANASLLDESTACAEAMHMLFESRSREQKKAGVNQFLVDKGVLPQNIALLKTKAQGLDIQLVIGDVRDLEVNDSYFGALLQYPTKSGELFDYGSWIQQAKEKGVSTILAADIMALTLLTSPGELGAVIAVGTTQRFGIPMGYGGPHAAFMACEEGFKRQMPGRIIGLSQDVNGNPALRMALQTREQHIKREKATSNICTAQVLLAVMAGMYAVYHGKEGVLGIAEEIHLQTKKLYAALKSLGYEMGHDSFFDTIQFYSTDKVKLKTYFTEKGINLNYFEQGKVSISISENTSDDEINELIQLFADFSKSEIPSISHDFRAIPEGLVRKTGFWEHEIFNTYHTETALMRYIKKLERKDLALNHSMIPLGSCTMKLNAAAELLPLSWDGFANMHPFAPVDQAKGYRILVENITSHLSVITGFYATSIQPNSGAQGEFAGLKVIRAYHESRGESHRDVMLIPESAHGTNPASAVLAGGKVVVVKNLESGEIDLHDLNKKIEQHRDKLCALMVTYPSTYGVFDTNIKEVTDAIHAAGGQVYMDGANMNAQVGLTSPARIGADVCHLNLHKTFAIPHGGGGPGVGPICVAEHLAPYLPNHDLIQTGGDQSFGAISAAPYGSAFILTISYAYIRMLGSRGLRNATIAAILNANYLKNKLADSYPILYQNAKGYVAHEFIIDCRPFKSLGIEVTDIAKRLMDYGFHAPTVSFPVAGTMMIEPTESEDKAELDRFAAAMISIKAEIDEIAGGVYDKENNVLKNAPHTLTQLSVDNWDFPYTRQKAAYPLSYLRENKFWASVNRVDDAYGDRNLICTCPSIEEYA